MSALPTAPAAGSGWSVGLDIGGTKVLGVVLDGAAEVRATLRVPTERGTDGVVRSSAAVVEQLCGAVGLAPGDLVGVGAGVPGLVDPESGEVTHAVNLGIDERGVLLAPLLSASLGDVPVYVDNDANVAALGAARVLDLSGDLAFLALGTGVAAGLLLGGEPRRGARGGAGEIGHLPYDPAGPACPCGQRGCLELYASGSALDAAWVPGDGGPAAAEVFARAADGDETARRLRDDFAAAVGAAVRSLVLTCDVDHVVLGGGVAEVGAPLLDAVAAQLTRQGAGSPFLRSLDIPGRLRIVPPGVPVAPIGAALTVRRATARPRLRRVPG